MSHQLQTNLANVNSLYGSADVYDRLVGLWSPPSIAEIGFYSGMATGLETPILELGCGTGRLSVPLAKLGHSVTGLDCSEELLSRARSRAISENVEVEFVHADVRNFTAEPKNRLVVSSFNFLSHLCDFNDLRSFFTNIRENMGSGGFFIIDQGNPEAGELEGNPTVRRLIGTSRTVQGEEVEVYESFSYDRATQSQRQTFFTHESGTVTCSTLKSRLFFPQELDNILRMFGFRILLKSGGFEMEPFTSRSERQIILCARETCDGQWALAPGFKIPQTQTFASPQAAFI